MDKARILVIEDDEGIRTQMKWALADDYDVSLATDADSAMGVMAKMNPPLVTLDLGLPPSPEDTTEGLKLLGRLLASDPTVKVVVVTGNPEREAALRAISLGAHDFLTKPIDIAELKSILKRAEYVHNLEVEHLALQKQLQQKMQPGDIIGECPLMMEVLTTIRKVATTDVPVLITGESGTGKELAAKAIHTQSLRRDEPFVPINCGAIPENLMESELFGHEKGAFTGASTQRKGRIDLASKGTLFLDEIAELPPALQVKLLRFLQDHKIERVGGRTTMEIDCRVIAATNRDVGELVARGGFREDLYYRLAVVNLELPPLRERDGDVALLVRTFINKFTPEGTAPMALSDDALSALAAHDWPGNVRELENRVRRAITLAEGRAITPEDLGLSGPNLPADDLDLKKAKEDIEKSYARLALRKHKGNISKAAEELGLSRPTMHNLLKKYNIGTEGGY